MTQKTAAQTAATVSDRPAGSRRFDLLNGLALLWMLGGAHLDSWAHNHLPDDLETFFTPWHAVLYSGFGAVVLVLLIAWAGNIRRGYHWRRAVPRGYELSLVGLGIFFVGGFGDMFWHELFGIEASVEGALSATHQLLDLGMILLSAGPLRAAWFRRGEAGSWWGFFPAALSMLLTLSAITLISQIAHPFTMPWSTTAFSPDSERGIFAYQVLGLATIALQTGFWMGLMLTVMRRWGTRLPVGINTFILTINAAALSVMQDDFRFILVAFAAGIIADFMVIGLPLWTNQRTAIRLYSALAPMVLYALYFVVLAITDDFWWRIHTISGGVTIAGGVGYLLSALAFPAEVESAS